MKFINNKEDRKVRSGETGNYTWTLVKTGDTIDLPLEIGQACGFTFVEEEKEKPKATKGKAGKKTVETKQKEVEPPVPEESAVDEVESEPDSEPEESKE